MILIQLFLIFAQIGLFAFGGGYAILPLIEKEIVNNFHWLTYKEFLEVVTISQLTPGPISINAACIPGRTLTTFPLYIFPVVPFSARYSI